MEFRRTCSRRDLIRAGIGVAAGAALLSGDADMLAGAAARPDPWRGLKVGVASYSLRKLSLDDAITAIQKVDLHYVSIKDVHLSLKSSTEERKAVVAKFKAAGITPLSCGNIAMSNEANIRQAFEYARDIEVPTIVCAPNANVLPIVEKMVKEFNIRVAIHNHGPEDKEFPGPDEVWAGVQSLDKRVGLCIDVGHTARAGQDPVACILKYHERLYDMHFKDIKSTAPNGAPTEVGKGVLDIKGMLAAVLKIKYRHQLAFEYEVNTPDPVPGLAESVQFTRETLATITV